MTRTIVQAALCCALVIPKVEAGTNSYTISVDTSMLAGRSGGPFSVAFYLSDGSGIGDRSTTITLSGFDFAGGNAQGSSIQLGGASGSLASSVILTDSLFLNSFIQQFSPGNHLAFSVSATSNIDLSPAADLFAVSILDGAGQPIVTQTGQPFFNPFAAITFSLPNPSLQNYAPVDALLTGATVVGSMAQIASAGGWQTSLTLVNLGSSVGAARLNLFSDPSGAPLPLPLTFPQVPLTSSVASGIDRIINSNAQLVMETTGPNSAQPLVGWGELLATPTITGFATFSNPSLGWNAVVPLETRSAGSYVLAFDNTNADAADGTAKPLATGVAVANLAASAANIPVIIRDDTGAQIGTGTIALAPQGHKSFMLNDPALGFPVTNGKRGTIEFDTPTSGQISVLGLRAYGSAALTTLPVLANVGTNGGAIAHTTFNGGFTSTFYIVNTGLSTTPFTLSFFDESGSALLVPLALPQSGAMTTTSALTRTLAAGAMLIVETQTNDTAAGVVGSAQLTTAGNISAFEIFRWTPFGQEASVPLETRTPSSFILVFDNTNGLTTGVALANLAVSPANISINLRDDSGALLQTGSTNLTMHGHTSFLLPDAAHYPITANRRGTAEFVVPAGGQISVIGLRASGDGTLTTIPVLAK